MDCIIPAGIPSVLTGDSASFRFETRGRVGKDAAVHLYGVPVLSLVPREALLHTVKDLAGYDGWHLNADPLVLLAGKVLLGRVLDVVDRVGVLAHGALLDVGCLRKRGPDALDVSFSHRNPQPRGQSAANRSAHCRLRTLRGRRLCRVLRQCRPDCSM